MDRTAIKTFATWARRTLREQVSARLNQFGITTTGIEEATPVAGGLTIAGQVLDKSDAQHYQRLRSHLAELQRQEKTLRGAVEAVIDEIAYTWFNRLAALRFMEVNGYLNQRVLSSGDPTLVDPDILREAGAIAEVGSLPGLTLETLAEWRNQASREPNPDEALYRRLLGIQCQALSATLPFLFDPDKDYLTLFMPGNLLNQDSIVRRLVNDIPEEDWRDSSDSENGVEIIGWLYQFYISERKDEVIGAKSKIAARDIPAATQLFTPHWIVCYMVENSLGRLWLESHPESGLRSVMKYYLEPVDSSQLAANSGQQAANSGQQAANSSQFTVDSSQWTANSSQFTVDSSQQDQLATDNWQLTTAPQLTTEKSSQLPVDSSQSDQLKTDNWQLTTAPPLATDNWQLTTNSPTDNWQLTTDPPTGNWQLTTENSLPTQPQDLTVMDPACGSGHILVYAFDLLFEIYKEQGYRERDIPALILEHNLHGLDIDERAVQLASFAVLMKARAKNPRFFRDPSKVPHLKITTVKSTRQLVSSSQLTVHSSQQESQLTTEKSSQLPVDSSQSDQLKTENWQLKTDPPTGNWQLATGNSSGIFSLPDLNRADWQPLLDVFQDADNLGSLITPPAFDGAKLLGQAVEMERNNPVFAAEASALRGLVEQAELLRQRYWVVVANPPYMGSKGMNATLKDFAQNHYPESKSDLFAISVERMLKMLLEGGHIGLMTPFTWMFLSSYEKLRKKLLGHTSITSLIRPEYHAFFDSAYVPLCSFTLRNEALPNHRGTFIDLSKFYGADLQPIKTLEAIANPNCGYLYYAKSSDFEKIPGSAIAYWSSQITLDIFEKSKSLFEITISEGQNITGNVDRFVRFFWEVDRNTEAKELKWRLYTKGGDFRRWRGNIDFVVDRSQEAVEHYRTDSICRLTPEYLWFKEGITWSPLSSAISSFRRLPKIATFDKGGLTLFFHDEKNIELMLGLLNSIVAHHFLKIINPTLNLNIQDVRNIPVQINYEKTQGISNCVIKIENLSQQDWDNFETSWDFQTHPLVQLSVDSSQLPVKRRSLKEAFQVWQAQSEANFQELKRLEEENNRYWIDAYGLQDELTPEVPDDQITIRCADLERDIKSLISYAVGCMMGRYSLQRPGLILASQGQGVEDYWEIVNSSQLTVDSQEKVDSDQFPVDSKQQELSLTTDNWPLTTDPPTDNWPLTTDNSPPSANLRFSPDQDAILPITDQAYFDDDIVSRFVEFVKVAFGAETLTENLDFIANALTLKSGETALDRIRRYFVSEFISDHIKTYKKRPIYWLFTSGKPGLRRGAAFGALVYLHRYSPDTVGRIRTDYVLELQVKLDKEIERLQAQVETASTTSAKRSASKRLKNLQDQQLELRDYQAKLQTFADRRIQLDLDDGVAYNYTRFKGIVYEGTDLKMADLEAKAQWKLDLLKQQEANP